MSRVRVPSLTPIGWKALLLPDRLGRNRPTQRDCTRKRRGQRAVPPNHRRIRHPLALRAAVAGCAVLLAGCGGSSHTATTVTSTVPAVTKTVTVTFTPPPPPPGPKNDHPVERHVHRRHRHRTGHLPQRRQIRVLLGKAAEPGHRRRHRQQRQRRSPGGADPADRSRIPDQKLRGMAEGRLTARQVLALPAFHCTQGTFQSPRPSVPGSVGPTVLMTSTTSPVLLWS